MVECRHYSRTRTGLDKLFKPDNKTVHKAKAPPLFRPRKCGSNAKTK